MTIFSGIIMLNSKKYKSNTLKISVGLFMCVIIYYLNNIFNVMGATEKINYIAAVWMPLLFLLFAILILVRKINEK
jgi:lipopolysaccharide export system permease protein